MSHLLFIVGMQKSGTSLLNRMLMKQSFITNPFLPEGAAFWGDIPPFSPTAAPCGELYQQHLGNRGHQLDSSDVRPADLTLLQQRISDAAVRTPVLMNKNPYLAVRIPWLKAIFPQCRIIAVYRNPVANVYSLLKKYIPHETVGAAPEHGWWGIKPNNWQNLLNEDKLIQSTRQWLAVNQQLLHNDSLIDGFVDYETLCDRPNEVVATVQHWFGLNLPATPLPVCKSFNHEYQTGSRLASKNQAMRQTNQFNLQDLAETVEVNPLKTPQVSWIQQQTDATWAQLSTLALP
jgi:hypothetical protein